MSREHEPALRVEVLGPLQLVVDGAAVDVRGPKRRALLTLLALAAGRTVPVDHLLDALWPAEIPESGRRALHTQISRLRAHLGPAADRLHARQDGYRLDLRNGELDLVQARDLLAVARNGKADVVALREAHALWRGPVLADLTDIAPIAATVEGCARLHQEVTDALVAAAVDAGEADGIVGLAAESLAADPLREPAVLSLMRALAAAGRAPEALRTGREYRRRLADETGLDPSSALGELERTIAGGAAGPPPREARAAARSATRLVGREAQVAALHRLLAAERLVTVVGPGGVGKTRVALELAHPGDGPTVLALAPVTAAAAIPHALASALGLSVVSGDVLAACVAVLGDDPRLLVIDNCEHLLDAVRDTVSVLLGGCPRLTILATSREPLGLAEEYSYRLSPLPIPSESLTADALPQVASVAVFLDRAGRVRPVGAQDPADLRLVADIVRHLDGMPLAIELAAGRLSTFSLADLHARLGRSLDLLGGGRPAVDARHRTLRATVEWSYRLLSADEQRLFRHLSIFVDGVDVTTAERLTAELVPDTDPGSVVSRLVDASMIDAEFNGDTRFRMLETLRAFGLDRLAAAGEDDAAATAIVRWAVELAIAFEQEVATEREPAADALLRREIANLRAAWRLTRDRGLLDDAVTLVTALFDAIAYRDLVEVRDWAIELADDPALAPHPRAAQVLGTAAEAAYHRGQHPRAERYARTGLELATDPRGSWPCLMVLSVVALARGVYPEVIELCEAADALAMSPRENLGIAALAEAYGGGDLNKARGLNRRGLEGAESPTLLGWGAYVDGEIESLAGHSELAEHHYLRAVEHARDAGATFIEGVATVGLLAVRATAGRVHDALQGYREVIDYFARTGNWTHQWTTLRNLANLLRQLGDHETGALLDAAADHAPDAPAVGEHPVDATHPLPGRSAVLDLARKAIDHYLSGEGAAGPA